MNAKDVKIGDYITATCDILYPSFVVKEGDKGIIVRKIWKTFMGVRWEKHKYNEKMECHIIDISRKEFVPYFNHIPDGLFEL